MSQTLTSERTDVLWAVARLGVFLTTAGVVVGLWAAPDATLGLFWYVLIPILPAVFLVNVELWRNVCPVATLNQLSGSRAGSAPTSPDVARRARVVGIVLLALLAPARHLLFNESAGALGLAVLGIFGAALAGGFFFAMKSGFCNTLCPILPVERLYGQRPLIAVPGTRCTTCSGCTHACLDLAPRRSALVQLRTHKPPRSWTKTSYGAFALAFPGLIVAYHISAEGVAAHPLTLYGTVGLWSLGSWLLLRAVFAVTYTSAETALVLCAALAAGLYYWFTPLSIVARFDLPDAAVWGMRFLALSLVAAWLSASAVLRSGRPSLGRPR